MSIGIEFIKANSFDDWLPNVSREEQLSGALSKDVARDFIRWVASTYPGEWHPSLENAALIEKFMEVNDVCPASLRNYKISFIYLRSEGLFERTPVELEPEPELKTKYSRPVVQTIQKSAEEQQTEADEIKRLRELDSTPRSRKKIDVGDALRREYQQSLAANHDGGKKRHMTEGEARRQIGIQMPHLKIDSPEFNMWCARLQFNQYSDD